MKMYVTTYREGAMAYWQGKSIVDNPYTTGWCYYWENGYVDARALDNGDIEYSPDHPAAEEHYK